MFKFSRRQFLGGSAIFSLISAFSSSIVHAAKSSIKIIAEPQFSYFFGNDGPSTKVWAYGDIPGPTLKIKQDERLRVSLLNNLPDPTTIHWHGLRIQESMDGVPYLSQAPIEPGETFSYDFIAKDAGTYWYHPHVNSAEQVGRGLSGALIVEEPDPIKVDRDIVWVIDDWYLGEDAGIMEFGNFHAMSHAGRMGNVATINGLANESFSLRSGERIRLRLINTANARVFGLQFEGLNPWRIAIDGHPITPFQMNEKLIIVPPGGRTDLILDFTGAPGDEFNVHDKYYSRQNYTLTKGIYSDEEPLRTEPLGAPEKLTENPVQVPDLRTAEHHEMIFEGGAMGGLRQAELDGEVLGLRDLANRGLIWAINGKMYPPMEKDNIGEPLLSMKLGQTYILTWTNHTAFDHPIHLHGHSFHVISIDGTVLETPIIMDTVLINSEQSVEIAFVADNPGKWALHCHVLEHAKAGMMGYVVVS